MYIEVSDEVERKQIKTRDGSVYDIVEQAVAWHVPGKTFPEPFMMRVDEPLTPGRYFPKGKPTFRPYQKFGDIPSPEALAIERFELVPLSDAQSKAVDELMATFKARSSLSQKAIKAAS